MAEQTKLDDFKRIAGDGSVRVHIFYASLADLEFHSPSLDDQNAIAGTLDDAVREINALEWERTAPERQRDAVATELPTGRIRVPQVWTAQ